MASELSSDVLPRVLIVSRRTLRKNKFVDFVGEYHLDLIVKYGAAPVIVPRVAGMNLVLKSFEPIHGVLLCEGEDINPSLYASSDASFPHLPRHEDDEIQKLHGNDTAIDREKDSIELTLARLCLDRNIPFLGICRGSQLLNVACGGTLYQDIEKELSRMVRSTAHIDHDNYDGSRHTVQVVENTPLHSWFRESLPLPGMKMWVNSYHHQGVRKLAQRLVSMAVAPDGLVEAFYDPDAYNPVDGKFIVGLQFHPERMRTPHSDHFEYPGCPRAYQEFVKAVVAYQDKTMSLSRVPRLRMVKSDKHKRETNSMKNEKQHEMLMKMGVTVRDGSKYSRRLKMTKVERVIGKMTVEQLSELLSFHGMMGKLCSETMDTKLKGLCCSPSVDL